MTLSYSKPPRRSPHSLELTPESSRVLFCDLTTAFSFALSSYCLPPSSLCSSTPWTLALQSFPKHTVVSSLIIFTHLVPMPAMLISFGHWPRPHLRPPLLSFSESLSLWFSPKVLPLLSFHLLSLSPQTFSSPYSALFSPWHSLKPFYFCVCLLYALFYIRIVSSQKVTLISSLGEAEGKREELQVSDSLPHFPKSQVSPLFGFFGSSW